MKKSMIQNTVVYNDAMSYIIGSLIFIWLSGDLHFYVSLKKLIVTVSYPGLKHLAHYFHYSSSVLKTDQIVKAAYRFHLPESAVVTRMENTED